LQKAYDCSYYTDVACGDRAVVQPRDHERVRRDEEAYQGGAIAVRRWDAGVRQGDTVDDQARKFRVTISTLLGAVQTLGDSFVLQPPEDL
jgi:hypothetical protein